MIRHALLYAQLGLYVFPVKPGGKAPLVKWRDQSTTEPDKIEQFWRRWPKANIGLDCGKAGLYVIDADGPEGITEWNQIADAGELHGQVSQETGGGGLQIFFRNPNQLPNTAKVIAQHIDTRGFGGYVIIPPSKHPSGRRYEWVIPPGAAPLITLPEWLEPPKPVTQSTDLPIVRPTLPASSEGAYWLTQAIQRAGPGTRNSTGFWLAIQLRDDGMTIQEAAYLLAQYQAAVSGRGNHPYTLNEALHTLRAAYSRAPRTPARKGQLCTV